MIKTVKPTTNARRKMSFEDTAILSKTRGPKSLLVAQKRSSGRDLRGRISIRHRGGGAKKMYRLVDFKTLSSEITWVVQDIHYDPNRSAHIALLKDQDSEKKCYIIAPEGIERGHKITGQTSKKPVIGQRALLADLPIGTEIHNIELRPGQGGKLVRGAGTWAVLNAKEGKYAHIRLPSSEIRKVLLKCMASVGRVSNSSHNRIRLAKAGRKRWLGFRPTVRGKAMNPNSHPHGGGEGVNPIGLKHPKTPWGKPARGVRTRKNKRTSKFIITRRKK